MPRSPRAALMVSFSGGLATPIRPFWEYDMIPNAFFFFQTSFWTGMTFEINNPSERIISFKQFPALHVVVISVDLEHRHALSWVSGQHTGDKSTPPCHCKEPRMPWSYKKQKQVDSGSLLRIWGPLTAYISDRNIWQQHFFGPGEKGALEYELIGTGISSDRFRHLRPACGALHAPVLCIRKNASTAQCRAWLSKVDGNRDCTWRFLIKGSLDEKLPRYELLKMLKIQ